jgi:hypothetical protein
LASAWSRSTRWSTTFWFGRAFCAGSVPITFMDPRAIDPVVVPTSSNPLPKRSMPVSSTRGSRRPSRGSCSTRFGGTALRTGSTCATATVSTTTRAATTSIVSFTACVIALRPAKGIEPFEHVDGRDRKRHHLMFTRAKANPARGRVSSLGRSRGRAASRRGPCPSCSQSRSCPRDCPDP